MREETGSAEFFGDNGFPRRLGCAWSYARKTVALCTAILCNTCKPLSLDRHCDTVVGRGILHGALHKQFIPSLVVMEDIERAFVLETSLLRRPPTSFSKIDLCLFCISNQDFAFPSHSHSPVTSGKLQQE